MEKRKEGGGEGRGEKGREGKGREIAFHIPEDLLLGFGRQADS